MQKMKKPTEEQLQGALAKLSVNHSAFRGVNLSCIKGLSSSDALMLEDDSADGGVFGSCISSLGGGPDVQTMLQGAMNLRGGQVEDALEVEEVKPLEANGTQPPAGNQQPPDSKQKTIDWDRECAIAAAVRLWKIGSAKVVSQVRHQCQIARSMIQDAETCSEREKQRLRNRAQISEGKDI